jgi:protein-tyrosine kinase
MLRPRTTDLKAVTPSPAGPESTDDATPRAEQVLDRSIGSFLRQVRRLTDAQIEKIVAHQSANRMRFGEAAVDLGLASRDDVLWALSQQFHYPYAPDEGAGFNPELVAAVDPFNMQAEAMRGIRSQLLMGPLAIDRPRRALAVLSPNVGDGKSFFAANLAIVFSQLGEKTLLIDADMRTPRQHELFRVSNDAGLSGILSGRAESSVIHMVRDLPSLFVLPVGTLPPNPLELLQRQAFALLLRELLNKFDHVIVDTPASSHGADSRVAAAQCGVAMVIGRRTRSRMRDVHGLIAELGRGPAQFAGVVINEH